MLRFSLVFFFASPCAEEEKGRPRRNDHRSLKKAGSPGVARTFASRSQKTVKSLPVRPLGFVLLATRSPNGQTTCNFLLLIVDCKHQLCLPRSALARSRGVACSGSRRRDGRPQGEKSEKDHGACAAQRGGREHQGRARAPARPGRAVLLETHGRCFGSSRAHRKQRFVHVCVYMCLLLLLL